MIHGHSIIELTDVNTGEVERYEDNNLVTNGIKYYQQFFGLPSVIWRAVFGGIKIFENNIEENPDVVVAPADANMIGYACGYSNTADGKRGILNLDQSGILEDNSGIKLTWDFAQNQVNGKISCICITPERFATNPNLNTELYLSKKCAGSYGTYLIDYDILRRTTISYINELKNNNRIKLVFNQVPFIYCGITDDDKGKKLNELYVDIPVDFSAYKSTVLEYIGMDEAFYYCCVVKDYTTTEPATTQFLLIKIKKNTYEVITQEFSFSDPAYPKIYFTSTQWSFMFNGFLYLYYSKAQLLLKLSMEDFHLEKVIESELLDNSFGYSNSFIAIDKRNVICRRFIMGTDDIVRDSTFDAPGSGNCYPRGVLVNVAGGIIFMGPSGANNYQDHVGFCRIAPIMTINNLSTPVTKTADKTMKITYILREDYGDTPTPPTP